MPAGTLPEGFVISGRYTILSPLGSGGMGVVYKAQDRMLSETVALKVLRADLAESPDAMQRFLAEIKLARTVSHRNVCRLHEYGEFGGLRYISMAFVDGVDLKHVIRRNGPCAPDRGFDLAIQIAEGLEAIHAEGIIHRDLKTPNLMLDGRGVVRLMDFGIAKHTMETATAITGTGIIVGTPEYMSPEQVLGHKVDFRSDVYAAGIVIYELFTGRTPFQSETPVATLMKQVQEPPRLDGDVAAQLPRPILQVITRALAKDREQRHPSASALLADLRAARDAWWAEAADRAGVSENAETLPPIPLPGVMVTPVRGYGAASPATTAQGAAPTEPGHEITIDTQAPIASTIADNEPLLGAGPLAAGTDAARAGTVAAPAPRRAPGLPLAVGAGVVIAVVAVASWWVRSPAIATPPASLAPSAPAPVTEPAIVGAASPAPLAAPTGAPVASPRPVVVAGNQLPAVRDVRPGVPATVTPGPTGVATAPPVRTPSPEVAGLLAEAESAFAAQEHETALSFYEQALKLDPGNERARIGRDLCARALAAAPAALAARHVFAPGQTAYVPPRAKPDAAGPSGFETAGPMAVRRVDQAATAPAALVFEVEPPAVRPGEPYTVRVYLVNEGALPISLAQATVATTVDGKTVSGPVALATRDVAPRQRGLVLQTTDRWHAATAAWSIAVTVATTRGESFRNELRWR